MLAVGTVRPTGARRDPETTSASRSVEGAASGPRWVLRFRPAGVLSIQATSTVVDFGSVGCAYCRGAKYPPRFGEASTANGIETCLGPYFARHHGCANLKWPHLEAKR